MTFSWSAAIAQVIVIALIILFFVSLYLFVNRIVSHTRKTEASLKRMEEKMEILIKEISEKNQDTNR